MSTEALPYDVFLSHSAQDKAVVRPLAERLRQDGPVEFGTRNSEFGIAQAGTCGRGKLPFRDPLNQERRFIALRFDDACHWRRRQTRLPFAPQPVIP